jgi:hypothetical protein
MAAKRPITEVKQSELLDRLVGDWYEKAEKAKQAAADENAARLALYAHFYKEDDPLRAVAGTQLFGMPSGWQLDIERRINVRIDKAQLPAIFEAVKKLPLDPETGEVASLDGVIVFKPDLSDSAYRLMTREDVKEILDQALTFTPGTPGIKLEYKAPKANPKATALGNPFADAS